MLRAGAMPHLSTTKSTKRIDLVIITITTRVTHEIWLLGYFCECQYMSPQVSGSIIGFDSDTCGTGTPSVNGGGVVVGYLKLKIAPGINSKCGCFDEGLLVFLLTRD